MKIAIVRIFIISMVALVAMFGHATRVHAQTGGGIRASEEARPGLCVVAMAGVVKGWNDAQTMAPEEAVMARQSLILQADANGLNNVELNYLYAGYTGISAASRTKRCKPRWRNNPPSARSPSRRALHRSRLRMPIACAFDCV